MALLSSLASVAFFWLAFALNFVLLYLQLLYLPAEKRANTSTLLYRCAITFGFSVCFSWSLFRLLGLLFGWYLQNRSTARREKILSWVESNNVSETVGARDKVSSGGEKAVLSRDESWNGIVGFFHPFWYSERASRPPLLRLLMPFLAMPAEVEKGCSGLL